MSRENVDLVVRGLRAVGRRPKPDFDTVNALYHRDHVFVPLGATKLGESEARGGRVVVTNRFHGASSAIDLGERIWVVATVRDEKDHTHRGVSRPGRGARCGQARAGGRCRLSAQRRYGSRSP